MTKTQNSHKGSFVFNRKIGRVTVYIRINAWTQRLISAMKELRRAANRRTGY